MPTIERSALVPYSSKQMYDLVTAVEDYPEFVPGCRSTEVLQRSAVDQVARVDIYKAGISKSFTTRNTLEPYTAVGMELVDGPFKYLRGGWQFHALADDACKIVLKLEFEFSNRLLSVAFAKVFHELQSRMVDSFVRRAQQVYGAQLQ